METPKQYYPIGSQPFPEIREKGVTYIDKTDMIYEMVSDLSTNYFFLSRPRRFGKTLLDVMHDDEELPKVRNAMRNFYSPLKGAADCLRFVFLTGITKFLQLSIFSELNNIVNISMDPQFATICGITEEEMLRKFEVTAVNIGGRHVPASGFDAPTEYMTSIVPLLYQSGYTTIKGYDQRAKKYLLDIPNYSDRFALYNLPIVKIGINFSSKTRTINDWVIER